MSRHTEELNGFLSEGFSREDATDKADQRAISRILDEDEEYLKEQEALDDEEEELDGIDDDLVDFDYDEDEEEEIDFEDGYKFSDSDEDEY